MSKQQDKQRRKHFTQWLEQAQKVFVDGVSCNMRVEGYTVLAYSVKDDRLQCCSFDLHDVTLKRSTEDRNKRVFQVIQNDLVIHNLLRSRQTFF